MLGTGWNLRVLKDTGPAHRHLRRATGCGTWDGYLAVAHTRMATESAVTVLHSHPFVPDARPLRGPQRLVLELRHRAPAAAGRRRPLRLGQRLRGRRRASWPAGWQSGDDLEEATRWVMKEMDGFFTLVITSADGMSVVRDAFACKPAVVAETPGYVAVASEYRALAELPGIADAVVFEPRPEEVYTWRR